MSHKHTLDELDHPSRDGLATIILTMQGQLETLNENIGKPIEQVRIANQHRFGRKTETMQSIEGQMPFFVEADALYDKDAKEPEADEVLPPRPRRKKTKGQRDIGLKDFPEDIVPAHAVPKETLDAFYGPGCWKRMPDETYKRLRHGPGSWTVEVHTVEVYVGTDGDHQDGSLRGGRPKDIFRNSIVTPSLLASILNAKYVDSAPLNRIEQEFMRNGANISRQAMSNWIVGSSQRYFAPLVERMRRELLKLPVTRADETPTQVVHDDRHPGSKSHMWVHRSGGFCRDRPVVIYGYQKGRDHELPLAFYQDHKGVLVTDGLQQYHLAEKKLKELINANCWVHARRDHADAIKAADKSDPNVVGRSAAYQALSRIPQIYKLEGALKDPTPEQRLLERQKNIQPPVGEYFAWVKNQLEEGVVPPKSKTADGLRYSVDQEKYPRVSLTDGNVPIDNSASERSIRTFCIGKKNWMFHDSVKGAQASAVIYSLSETAKLNDLRPYYYFRHLLTELPNLCDDNGNIEPAELDRLLPWSKELPDECRKPRR